MVKTSYRLLIMLTALALMVIPGNRIAQAHSSSSPAIYNATSEDQSAAWARLRITVRTATSQIPNMTAVDLAAACLPGEVAIGGGGAIGVGGVTGAAITTTGPLPTPVGTMNNPTAWHIIASNQTGTTQPITAWVLCVQTRNNGSSWENRNRWQHAPWRLTQRHTI